MCIVHVADEPCSPKNRREKERRDENFTYGVPLLPADDSTNSSETLTPALRPRYKVSESQDAENAGTTAAPLIGLVDKRARKERGLATRLKRRRGQINPNSWRSIAARWEQYRRKSSNNVAKQRIPRRCNSSHKHPACNYAVMQFPAQPASLHPSPSFPRVWRRASRKPRDCRKWSDTCNVRSFRTNDSRDRKRR